MPHCYRRFLGLRFLNDRVLRLHGLGEFCDVLYQRRVVGAFALRLVDVADDRADRPGRGLQCVEARTLKTHFIVVNTAHESVQDAGDGNAALHVGHVGTAMQGMARPMQLVRNVKWRLMTLAGCQVVGDDREVPGRFFREDIEQHRVHLECGFLRLGTLVRRRSQREYCCIWIAFGERSCARHQQADVGIRFGTDFKLLDQFRYRTGRLDNEVDHGRRTHERAIDQPVEQILDAPAILTDALGPDHAAAALECVKRTPDGYQRLHVVRRLCPFRQPAPDGGDLFLGLLDKEFEQLRIHVLRIRRYDRQRHNLGSLHLRLIGLGRLGRLRSDLARIELYRLRGPWLFPGCLRDAVFEIPQYSQAGFCVIQHVPGLAASGFHGLHVILDGNDCVCQSVGFLLRQ